MRMSEQRRLPGLHASRGPIPSLDRSDIVASAIALADADGLQGVSMRAVASRLGTSASALYRYVADRADLLGLMADQVARELRPFEPPPGGGIEAMVAVAQAQRDLYRQHPWLTEISFRMSAAGPETLRFFDACLGAMSESAAPKPIKFEALALVTALAAVFASRAPSDHEDGERLPELDSSAFPHLVTRTGEFPTTGEREDLLGRAVRGVLRELLDL